MRWIFLFCALTFSLHAQNPDYRLFNANHISIWFANNGDVAHNPLTNASGLEFPSGSGKHLVFESGVIWGCTVAGQLRGGGSAYQHALQGGTINSNREASDPKDARFRIYKICKSFTSDTVKDYREWPCSDGAPCDPITHQPILYGDEQMWWVSNDLEPRLTNALYGTPPIGLEVQTLVWNQNDAPWLDDIIFIKHTIIYKKYSDTCKNMYLGLWTDFDIGYAKDDFIGCDTLKQFSFGYNAVQFDSVYRTPPACGYMFLQTPVVKGSTNDQGYFKENWRRGYKNVRLSGHVLAISNSSSWPFPDPSYEWYNWMQGYLENGQQMINPQTGEPTRYIFSGNPAKNTGWIDGNIPPPGDRRSLLSCGPFTMAPGDTQEVVYAILAAQGIDRLQSVMKLQYLADRLRSILPVKVNDVQQIPDRIFIQNYPNPFTRNQVTRIQMRVPNLNEVLIQFEIIDILGRKIQNGVLQSRGNYLFETEWDGKDMNGVTVPSGMYFLRYHQLGFYGNHKIILMN